MKNLCIQGCFDSSTLKMLQDFGVENFAFDLRPTSPQLITTSELHSCLRLISTQNVELIFENHSLKTVEAHLDLVKNHDLNFYPQFRCKQGVDFYSKVKTPWVWMFHPDAQWREILSLPQLKKVLLPTKWKTLYQTLPELWEIVDHRSLEVSLQLNTFEEVFAIELSKDLQLGLDIDASVLKSYRVIDYEKVKRLQILEGIL